MNYELAILDTSENARAFIPDVEEGLQWVTERRGVPGKLTFSVLGDKNLALEEGAAVRLSIDGNPVFFGFIFSKKFGKNGIISVTAYDQLRYLNNKDTYVYENKTASQLIKAIPHKDCAQIAQSDFSSNCTMRTTQGWRLARTNCAR